MQLLQRWLGSLVLGALALGCANTDVAYVASLGEVAPAPSGQIVVDRLRALTPEGQRTIAASSLPALLPEDRTLLATAVVTSGPHFLAWSARSDGLYVSLHGTDHRWRVGTDEPEPAQDQVRNLRAVVSENEGIQTATWDEGGVAWALDVECARVHEDDRCARQDYVRALAETLEHIGGAQ